MNWRKKRAFPSSVIGEKYGRHSPPHFGEITPKMPLLRHPGMTLAFFARLLREPPCPKNLRILLANLETLKCRLAYPLFEGTQALKQPLQKPRLCGVK
jgi:hypothetical protein